MSYHLGISHHFPTLHRSLTSPTSSFTHSSPKSTRSPQFEDDLTEDSKDVLIERLNDLVSRLSTARSLDDGAVTAIHAQVDKIEALVRNEERQQSPLAAIDERVSTPTGLGILREDDNFWGPPSPSIGFRMRMPPSVPAARPKLQELPRHEVPKTMSTARAEQLAKEAEELAELLASTVADLQARREESDHIHDLLLTRAEKAAERILFLEYRISEMADDFAANSSELKFLRIQLQAIEAQCVPIYQDPLLAESIANWRVDWEDIDRRARGRRRKFASGGVDGVNGTEADGMNGSMLSESSILSDVKSP